MNVNSSGDAKEKRLAESITQQSAVKVSNPSKGLTDNATASAQAGALKLISTDDQVSVGLAQYISNELNPDDMAAARKKRVAELEKLVQSGQYSGNLPDVGKALAEEVSMEIATSAVKFGADDEG